MAGGIMPVEIKNTYGQYGLNMDKLGKIESMVIQSNLTQNDLEGMSSDACLFQSAQDAEKDATMVGRPAVFPGVPPAPPRRAHSVARFACDCDFWRLATINRVIRERTWRITYA